MEFHGQYRALVGTQRHLALGLLIWLAGAMMAMAQECRLALVLALDVSSSVDAREDALQRSGLGRALLAPEVQQAFFSSPQPVALAVFEWSGRYNQQIMLDWRLIRSTTDLTAAAAAIARSQRGTDNFPTALGYALGFGAGMLQKAPACDFKTIDISGDGVNNEGFGPALAYAEFPFDAVTVNGLVINGAEFEAEITVVDFYRREVLFGPGAFLEIANGFEDYERAMRRKLERELRAQILGAADIGTRRLR